MELYDSLLKAVHDEYDTLRVLKKSARGEVSLYATGKAAPDIFSDILRKQ